MRMLMNVKVPHQTFNAAVKDGSAGAKLAKILEAIKPEAVYFTEQSGHRGRAGRLKSSRIGRAVVPDFSGRCRISHRHDARRFEAQRH